MKCVYIFDYLIQKDTGTCLTKNDVDRTFFLLLKKGVHERI